MFSFGYIQNDFLRKEVNMDKKYLSINFNAQITPIQELNPEFTLCKCFVQGIGKNRNGSYMSKENVQKYSPFLSYCPVVGHIIEATDPVTGEKHKYMGGHDFTINENWEIVDLTVPYGVVVNDTCDYEIVNEYGTDVEYLTANVILWTGRYPELKEAIYSENFWFNQSMEINPIQYRNLEEDSNYIELLEWNYSALCLLGKADDKNSPEHTEPCFISSSVIPVEFSKNDFMFELEELKNKISFCFKNNSEKGGSTLDKKLEILQKFSKTIEDLDFSIEDMSEEELSAKMEELYGEQKTEPIAFSATYRQKRDALNNALDPIIVKDDEGNYLEETYFWVEDFDDEYVYVEKSYWALDNYECTYGRFTYIFDEATLTATITSEFEEMVKMWLTLEEKEKIEKERLEYETKYSTLEQEFSDYKAEHSFLDSDFNALKEYKEGKEVEERKNAEDTLFADYEEKIGKTEEFKTLKSQSANYSLDELKKECLCIVGMYSMNSSKDSLKFSIEKPEVNDDAPYGGIIEKYLNK